MSYMNTILPNLDQGIWQQKGIVESLEYVVIAVPWLIEASWSEEARAAMYPYFHAVLYSMFTNEAGW